MIDALSETGIMVEAEPKMRAKCPVCGAIVIAKCGELVTWHWAHEARADCDLWSESETDWHINWKRSMPRCEVVMEKDGAKHRADGVTKGGTVVEFQHSAISSQEIRDREQFYQRMVWVFDAREAWNKGRISVYKTKSKTAFWMRWIHERTSIAGCTKPVYLDLGQYIVRLEKRLSVGRYGIKCGEIPHFVSWANGAEYVASDDDAFAIGETLSRESYEVWRKANGIASAPPQFQTYALQELDRIIESNPALYSNRGQ